ncbi:MAG: class I adenylate-forming enzyme family protein [Pseudomonadales bacterium]
MNTDDQFNIQGPLLPDMVRLHGKWYPDKAALIDEQKTLSWSDIDRHSNQVANGLLKLGIRTGDSVAVLMGNCVEFAEIMFGIMKAGAVVVPLNVAVNEESLESMLNDSASKAIFFTTEHHQRMADRLGAIPSLLADTCFVHCEATTHKESDYARWRNSQIAEDCGVEIDDADPCNIIYSSGTTGLPKGIKHQHRRRIQSMYELALAHRYHFGAIAVCPIGLYSNIAWASLFCSLIVGGTCVIQSKFDPKEWIDTVEKYRVSHTMMVPLQFQKVLESPNFSSDAVSSLEAVISGGSPLFEGLKKRVNEQLNCAVIELYGLTEGFMTTLQPEEAEGKLTSVGKPVRGNDYIIVDDNDTVLPWGNSGEICVRSVHWMLEYHKRPDATRDVTFLDDQGKKWLRTGDIGRVDHDGFLYIVDRKKDMILSGGQNIYPADIEAIAVEHPAVSEVAVIGVPHEKWGETPLALVVLQDGGESNAAENILSWINERVGKRQRLSSVVIRTDLPRNPNGKILKRELRKEYWNTQ